MAQQTLVTHVIPHLDDIAAFWLLVRFDPACANAPLKYVETSPEGVHLADGEIGVGVGRGKYDEHKGDKKDSAASLVWKDLKARKLLPGGAKGRAIEELTEYVKRGDLGEFVGVTGPTFSLPEMLRAITKVKGEDSESATRVGFKLLDALVVLYEECVRVDEAIKDGFGFRTRWGKGIAVSVDALPASVSNRIAEKGYAMVLLRYPDSGFQHIRCTPGTKADLSKLGHWLQKEEPEARWYLHHSHKLLLQGDPIAPIKVRSKFTPKELAALIRKFYA